MITPPLEATGVVPMDVVGAFVDASVGASVANEPWRYREPSLVRTWTMLVTWSEFHVRRVRQTQ